MNGILGLIFGKRPPALPPGVEWDAGLLSLPEKHRTYRATGKPIRRYFQIVDLIRDTPGKRSSKFEALCHEMIALYPVIVAATKAEAAANKFANWTAPNCGAWEILASYHYGLENFHEAIRVAEEGIAAGAEKAPLQHRIQASRKRLATIAKKTKS